MSDPTGAYQNLSDADLWEHYRDQGLSPDEATHHVNLRAQARGGPAISAQEATAAQDIGPVKTALETGGRLVGSLPRMVGQMLTPVATHIVQSLHTSPAGQAEVERAGQDIHNLFGKLDPANLMSPEDEEALRTSQGLHPLATDIGTLGGIFGIPAVMGAKRYLGNRAETAEMGRRLMRAQTETAEERLAQLRAPSPASATAVPAGAATDAILPGGMRESVVRSQLARLWNQQPERIEAEIARMRASGTPSGVAPTVPSDALPMPGAPPIPPPAGGPPPRVTSPEPIPGSPQGMTAIGPPTPPPPPTRPDIPGRILPYYPRGGRDAQAQPPLPVTSGASSSGALGPGQLKTLLGLPQDQFDAASGMLAPEIRSQVQALRAAGASPAHVDATVSRLGTPGFTGGGFQGTSQALATPAYRRAGILAGRILKDRALLEQYPQFAGQTPEQATTTLQRMIVEHARGGGKIPPITSLARFLQGLSPIPAGTP